ncbi:hypothetical protein GCM10010303_13860 [Streptomyces purpurascens]|nr:hypothetical protein GCM10010303_13860 [Streptomyces purpurascens]
MLASLSLGGGLAPAFGSVRSMPWSFIQDSITVAKAAKDVAQAADFTQKRARLIPAPSIGH